jgi:hypothetical protein
MIPRPIAAQRTVLKNLIEIGNSDESVERELGLLRERGSRAYAMEVVASHDDFSERHPVVALLAPADDSAYRAAKMYLEETKAIEGGSK